jgi:hypothetical protein
MTSIAPPPYWYIRAATLRILQGWPVTLPVDPDPEPESNVVSIAGARTRRATAQMMRGRSWPSE